MDDGLACRQHAWPERCDCPLCPPTVSAMTLDDPTARDLSRTAANVRTWTEKRNEAIKAARASGAGVREIARATRLNPATVHNIIQPRSRRGTDADNAR